MKLRVIILAVCMLTMSAGFVVAETLKVNTSIKPPFSTKDETGFFDLLLKELGKRINHEVELIRLPPERALFSANEGISDAELPRIAGLEKKYPNLVPVEEKVIDYRFVSFMRGTDPKHVHGWEGLKGKRVGHLIGWKIFENNIPTDCKPNKLTKPVLLFDMLDKGRIDVALYESYAGWNIIRSYGHMGMHECPTPLAVKPMYLYFHKTHEYLVPLATKALREMKADGTYDAIAKKTLKK